MLAIRLQAKLQNSGEKVSDLGDPTVPVGDLALLDGNQLLAQLLGRGAHFAAGELILLAVVYEHADTREYLLVHESLRRTLDTFVGADGSADLALEAFPVLAQRMTQREGSLSGGEQQMLAMSRALLKNPRLLLLDEISFGLAPRVTRRLFDVVAKLALGGTTVVLVEQYLSDALRLADVVYVLARGEVVFAGEPGELAGKTLPGYMSPRPLSAG